MAVKFGSLTGRRERESLRPREGEVVCGERVFIYLRNIEKTYSFEDEFFTCSIGVTLPSDSTSNVCLTEASIRVNEEARPKYKPDSTMVGIDITTAEELGYDGTALTTLACPIKVITVTIDVSARYKSDGTTLLSIDEILNSSTADGLIKLKDLVTGIDYSSLHQVITDKSVDRPIDDFIDQSITYRARISYPQSRPWFDEANLILGTNFSQTNSTVNIDATLRQQDTPMRRVQFTVYGLKSIND